MSGTSRFLRSNGITLHYLDWGGDAPPLLFLHPTGFHAHVWEPFAERLAGRYHCMALDSRGHGDSDRPGQYGWPDYADDLEGFLDALGLSGVTGIGHSAGATSLAVVAARRPGLFVRLVLIEPILFLGHADVEWQQLSRLAMSASRRRMEFPNREAMLANYAAKPPFNRWEPGLLAHYVRQGVTDQANGSVRLKCSGDDEAAMYAWGPRPLGSETILPAVSCPVLLIGGSDSDSFPSAAAHRAAALIPASELVTVSGASHFVPFERPIETQSLINRFLAKDGFGPGNGDASGGFSDER